MRFLELILVRTFVAERHALFVRGFRFGSWSRRGDWELSEQALLASYPSLRAEDLVSAWYYARSHGAEIEAQIRENEAA